MINNQYIRSKARAAIVPHTKKLGSLLLRSRPVRGALNDAYEGLGPGFDRLINIFFSDSRIPSEFVWRCRVSGRDFSLPVFPELQRSWNNALVWGWAGYRSTKQLYDFYLRFHDAGTFMDIGANDGMHSYPFASHGYRCICFEPQASCIDYIERVCRINHFSNVSTVRGVLSDEQIPAASFFVSRSSWYSSLVKEHVERLEAAEMITVSATTLDAYCRQYQVGPPLFVKIDVEGCEWRVIQGGREFFKKFRPDVFVEIFSPRQNKERFWDFFQQLGYDFYLVQSYVRRPIRRVRTLGEFLAAGGEDAHADFFLSSEPEFGSLLERCLS